MAEEQKTTLTGNQLAQLANQERQKLSEINRRVGSLQGFRNELQAAKDALEEIAKNEKGEKILVNLGAGIFVEANVSENSKALTSIAGNVFKEKNTKEISKTIEKKIETLDKNITSIAQDQQKTIARLNQLEQVLAAGRDYISKTRQKN